MKLGYDNEHEVKAKIKYMGKLKKRKCIIYETIRKKVASVWL